VDIGTAKEGKHKSSHAHMVDDRTVGRQGTFRLLFLPELERSAG
jgi:hypothetical protein